MKTILFLIGIVALLSVSGCVSASISGVDHTEYPGDMDHGESK